MLSFPSFDDDFCNFDLRNVMSSVFVNLLSMSVFNYSLIFQWKSLCDRKNRHTFAYAYTSTTYMCIEINPISWN